MRRLRRCSPGWPSSNDTLGHTLLTITLGVVLAAVYRYCWLDAGDPFRCAAVLDQGEWLDPAPRQTPPLRRFENWQPPGCLLHDYTGPEVAHCLKSKRLLFVGDSTTRQIFWAVAKKLDAGGAEREKRAADKHTDLVFSRAEVNVEFIWDPFLNSSRLHEELVAFQADPRDSTEPSPGTTQAAAMILIGGGLWYARHVEVNPMRAYKEAIDNIVPFMNASAQSSSSIAESVSRQDGSSNFLLFAPVQVPWYEALSPARQRTITPENVNNMNDYLQQLSAFQGADVVWSYSLMTWELRPTYQESGMHVIETVAARKADVLLNLRCNAQAAGPYGQGYPYDRTCCTNYRRPGWVQSSGLLAGLVILPFLAFFGSSDQARERVASQVTIRRALLTVALVTCYCFYADRTQVFNKLQKHFAIQEFSTYCWIVFGLGIFTIRRTISSAPAKTDSKSLPVSPQSFLSLDQTNEWKGWMQALILIYDFTGAARILWIYQLYRLLVASYLFMTGFGHTMYFYQTGDYSLRRVASVLVRLNLLSCALAYMMRTDYLFYYLSSMVSFWFVVVYLTMRIGHARNHVFLFALGKIVVSALLVTGIIRIHGFLEFIFAILRYTCRIHWDLGEWRTRTSLDIYVAYVGMLCALLYLKISTQPSSALLRESPLVGLIRRHMGLLRAVFAVAAVVVLYGFYTLTQRSPNEADYNWWHPYISCLPIISFVILRNISPHLRNYHSTLLAWLGGCSLETYTLHFHIWLAGDAKGLLSLNVASRWIEKILLTIVFIWMSHAAGRATAIITSTIVDGRQTTSLEPSDTTIRGKRSAELPRVRSHTDANGLLLPPEEIMGCSVRNSSGTSMSWKETFVMRWRDSLRFRMGSLAFVLWALNVAYL